ncbi:MAG: VOC family protein [Sphingomonadales bacterium]|nr:VOC family protein [Sphingomonadales bacterium]MBD3773429.1 VOC family protein [Paracoccaceae bacterium]
MAAEQDRGAFIWYELMTPDAAAAKQFYDAVVGWNLQQHGGASATGAQYYMIGRSDGGFAGGVLELTGEMIEQGASPAWLPYICIADVDGAAGELVAAGGATHLAPTDMAGVGRIAMVSDPWGAVFYLMNPTPPPGNPDAKSDVFSPTDAQHVRWHDLWTEDQPAAAALYGELFGWKVEGAVPMGDGREYQFLHNGAGMFGGLGTALADGPGPRWALYIGVDDIDRAMGAVEAGGGTLLGSPNPVPGGDFAVHAQDPQGARFGLVGPRKES